MLRFKEFLKEASIYFAHHMTDYNQPREKNVVKSLKKMGHSVDNPNTQKHQKGYLQKGMKHFTNAAKRADKVVFTRFPNQKIGAGVAKEIDSSIKAGKKAYEMVKKGQLRRVRALPKPYVMNRDETIKTLAKFKNVRHGSKKYNINWKDD